jgi:hypothetical protein
LGGRVARTVIAALYHRRREDCRRAPRGVEARLRGGIAGVRTAAERRDALKLVYEEASPA